MRSDSRYDGQSGGRWIVQRKILVGGGTAKKWWWGPRVEAESGSDYVTHEKYDCSALNFSRLATYERGEGCRVQVGHVIDRSMD